MTTSYLTSVLDRVRSFPRLVGGLQGRLPGKSDTGGESFLRQVRSHDFSQRSDAALRGLPSRQSGKLDNNDLASVFAVVNEAIERRFGAWRIFDAGFEKRSLGKYEQLAHRIIEAAPYKDSLEFYTNPDFLDGEAFDNSLTRMFEDMGLDHSERTIVKSMVYVAEKGSVEYWSDILLPAEFYSALDAKDTDCELRFRPTDEQLLAGLMLYEGNIVEMNAGEGKTIAAAFPAVAHALSGKSVHIVTANDYLTARDAEWLAPVYESLGLSVGVVSGYMGDDERRHAYRKHIVYGTMREFGFDYLRDNLKLSPDEPVQGSHDVVIVDEADHALIDQARTSLIISGNPAGSRRGFNKIKRAAEELIALQSQKVNEIKARLIEPSGSVRRQYPLLAMLFLSDPENATLKRRLADSPQAFKRVVSLVEDDEYADESNKLAQGFYFTVDSSRGFVTLTGKGQEFLEQRLGLTFDTSRLESELTSIDADLTTPLIVRRRSEERIMRRIDTRHSYMNQVYQMLRAYVLLKKNVDYLVTDDSIVLIDKFTGRTLPDNVYQKGLHATIQAKEGATIQPELETLARTSVPEYVGQYSHVSGMTGTAAEAADEFRQQYGLDVKRIAPGQPNMRNDLPTKLYTTRQEKLDALLDEISYWNRTGRPVLVGTSTVEQSEEISGLLDEHGIRHNLLNAVRSASEAEIVRNVGLFGAVTIATNMAGRGTDIIPKPDLNDRIIARFLDMIREYVDRSEYGRIEVRCGNEAEAAFLNSALPDRFGKNCTADVSAGQRSDEGPFPSSKPHQSGCILTIDLRGATSRETVTLEFGLGLHVIGTVMNPSTRVDRQLRGRSGRQGAFGSSRFLLSLEDETLAFQGHKLISGRSGLLDGPGLQSRLSNIQRDLERDDSFSRSITRDYTRVIESQTQAYYQSRMDIARSRSFHQSCLDFVDRWTRRFVERHFPGFTFTNYSGQFARMAESLLIDLEIDARHLEGVGLYELVNSIAELVKSRMDELAILHGHANFAELEKLLFLQTSDKLWSSHLDQMQEDMLTASLTGMGHKASVAEYAIRSFDAYEQFRRRVIDEFIPRLMTFPVESFDMDTVDEGETISSGDVAGILV